MAKSEIKPTRGKTSNGPFGSRRTDSVVRSKQDAGIIRPPSLEVKLGINQSDDIRSYTMEFHMTIRSRISELSTKQASMLLAVATYRAVTEGVDFTLYLAMEYLYSFLWKSGHDPLETRNDKVRKTLVLSDIVFSYIRGQWLTFNEVEKLPEQIVDEVKSLGWLPNERTFQSWSQHWQLERYLRVHIVPVDALRDRSKYQTAERYSGYTKGYGNDGSPASPGKTRPTRELDGDDTEGPPSELPLQEFQMYQTAIRLIEYAKAQRRQK